MMFSFLALHEIGAHYTYSHVPYDQTLHTLFGFSPDAVMGWQRNQYDRFLHLLYGLLLVLPLLLLLDTLLYLLLLLWHYRWGWLGLPGRGRFHPSADCDGSRQQVSQRIATSRCLGAWRRPSW